MSSTREFLSFNGPKFRHTEQLHAFSAWNRAGYRISTTTYVNMHQSPDGIVFNEVGFQNTCIGSADYSRTFPYSDKYSPRISMGWRAVRLPFRRAVICDRHEAPGATR